ncbi:MAG: MFS transporter [Dehalococcoidia bacterium]|nr:MAG: MFS transporter [Dehalococcoidia bacterium]
MTKRSGRGFFYGYWLVAFGFLCMLISIGCSSFVFSMFVKPLGDSFGWGRGEVMVSFAIIYIAMGIASPFVGRFVDRHGARTVIPLGALILGFGFLIVSRMSELYVFYLGYVLIGVGVTMSGQVPSSAIISNWFKRRRGMALGVMSAGFGAGGVVMAPIVGFFIENVGWREAYLAMAVIVWVTLIPLGLLLVRTKPSEMGLYPDGESAPPPPAEGVATAPATSGVTLRQAAVMSAFWLIGIAFSLRGFSSMGALQASVPFLDDAGFPTGTAAAALGTVGVGSALGKLFFGWLCDRIPPKFACAIGLTLQFAATLVLLSVHANSPMAVIWTFAILHGLGAGGWLPTMSMLVSTGFGLASYGAVFGAITSLQAIGTATGPLFEGMVYDATGTYLWAMVTFAALYVIAIPAVLLVKRPKAPAA